MSGKLSKLYIFWGALFLLSLLLVVTGLNPSYQSGTSTSVGAEKPAIGPEGVENPEEGAINWAMMLAAITAVVSIGGFVATTHFTIREDRRKVDLHQLQIKSLKREIEHKDLEIAKLRQERVKDLLPRFH